MKKGLELTALQAALDSAREMIEIIVGSVEDFTKGTPQNDDLTLVVAKRI